MFGRSQRRIQGDFFVIEQTEDRIVLGNRVCPFETLSVNRPSLCMMTSRVSATLLRKILVYSAVDLEQTIAEVIQAAEWLYTCALAIAYLRQLVHILSADHDAWPDAAIAACGPSEPLSLFTVPDGVFLKCLI
jgi:hypothetical protein